jgi:hypothetical protein
MDASAMHHVAFSRKQIRIKENKILRYCKLTARLQSHDHMTMPQVIEYSDQIILTDRTDMLGRHGYYPADGFDYIKQRIRYVSRND